MIIKLNKTKTYLKYLVDYLKYGDVLSVIAAIKFIVSGNSHRKDRIIRTSQGHFFCRKNTNDFQFANYYYEWEVKKYILEHFKDCNIFIDAGACIGDYSVLLSKKGIKCYAFEPVKNNFEILMKNINLNGVNESIMAFPFGLGSQNYTANFIFNPVNTGASRITKSNALSGSQAEIRTIDSLKGEILTGSRDHILFKIDVEGMECEVITGAAEFILSHTFITFIIETKHSGKEKIKNTLNQFAEFKYGNIDEYNFYALKVKNLN